jgi:uncharacterized DUF497 family protein
MAFEWDEDKRQANLVKHGVDFRRMTELFDGPTLEAVDKPPGLRRNPHQLPG